MNFKIFGTLSFLPLCFAVPVSAQTASKSSPVGRRAGYIIGRATKTNGSPVPSFTVDYSGFENGKLANMYNGQIQETLSKSAHGAGGRYAVKVPPGAYRASAYATYNYHGRLYNFEMEPAAPSSHFDYQALQLEKLRNGLVRNFSLKMQEKRAGASEESESLYRMAYYGGNVQLDCGQYEATLGGGNTPSPSVKAAYPADSRILLTLTPSGPMVDGSAGKTVTADLRLGDDGRWTFMVRGVFPGVYKATASIKLSDGTVKPLRISTKPSHIVLKPRSYDQMVFERSASATVDFLPNDLGPMPRFGVNAVQLYLGE